MDIKVCMKQVIDLEQLRIKPDTREPILEGVPVKLGDFEKCALEQAVRIKEQGGGKVSVVASGSAKLKETIKEALAMGADEAFILIDPAFKGSDAMGTARLLAKAITKIGRFDLILLGDGSSDNYSSEIPSRLAELLGLPQIGTVREIEVMNGTLRLTRDLEDALEVVEVDLPAVIAVTSELNTPRLPPLSAILKAGRKPLHEWRSDDIDISTDEVGPDVSVVKELRNLAPIQDRKGILFEDADEGIGELIKVLRAEGVLEE